MRDVTCVTCHVSSSIVTFAPAVEAVAALPSASAAAAAAAVNAAAAAADAHSASRHSRAAGWGAVAANQRQGVTAGTHPTPNFITGCLF